MKLIIKASLLLVLVFIFGACSSNVLEEPQAPESTGKLDHKIKRVLDLANAEMERLCPPESRAAIRIPDMDALHSIAEVTSRGGEDTLIYVVNYADNEGFALVSARDSEDPVLAVVPEGNYNPEVGSDNPGFNLFLDAAKDYVKAAPAIEITPVPDAPYIIENGKFVRFENNITHWGGIARLGDTHHWNQDDFYGQFCDNGLVGCGPLAVASIITYLRYQEHKIERINYTYPNHDIGYEDITWEELFKHKHLGYIDREGVYHSSICYEKDKEKTHLTIARFCRQIGMDSKAKYKYNPNRTSTDMSDLKKALEKYMPEFKVSNEEEFKSYTTMRYIDHGLLLMCGKDPKAKSGHAWISDGYDYYRTVTTRYESDVPKVLTNPIQYNWQYAGTYTLETSKNHILWGWGGLDDGWYSGDVFETTKHTYRNFKYISVTLGL